MYEDYTNGYSAGKYKNRINQVSDIVTELPQNVPDRIDELISKYRNSKQVLKDIAEFHAEYEHIHPFQDGNGRTGRAIIFKQCLDSNIIPVVIVDEDKEEYCHALHVAQVDNKYENLIDLFYKSQRKYYMNISRYI